MTVTLTLEGPGKNALSGTALARIADAIDTAAGRPLLIEGAGGVFSAGLDLREVAAADAGQMRILLELFERCCTALYLYPGPVVANVNGHAIAGGCVLALACDWRVATTAPHVKIGLNEVANGIRFPPRTLAIVRDRVPRAHHEQAILGARLFPPADALHAGLVDELADDPAIAARTRLAALAALPAEAYADTKRALRGASPEDLCPSAVAHERREAMLPEWTSPALKARITALLGR